MEMGDNGHGASQHPYVSESWSRRQHVDLLIFLKILSWDRACAMGLILSYRRKRPMLRLCAHGCKRCVCMSRRCTMPAPPQPLPLHLWLLVSFPTCPRRVSCAAILRLCMRNVQTDVCKKYPRTLACLQVVEPIFQCSMISEFRPWCFGLATTIGSRKLSVGILIFQSRSRKLSVGIFTC